MSEGWEFDGPWVRWRDKQLREQRGREANCYRPRHIYEQTGKRKSRQAATERQISRDRMTDRQAETEIKTEGFTGRQAETEAKRQRQINSQSQTDRQIERWTNSKTDKKG